MKKILAYSLIGMPIVVTGIGVGIYYSIQNNDLNHSNNSLITTKNQFAFPNITFDELYDEIKIKGNEAIIDDAMIAKFIKIVLMRIDPDEAVQVKIFKNSNSNVDIEFSTYASNNQKITKIYNMKLHN